MSKIQRGDICKVPTNVIFNFIEDQEMHSTITIENQIDRIVSYKIKTNKPGIYLVKPMDGQIFNKSTVTIAFRRKELTLQNFNMIQNNPGQTREKFLIELSCEIEDAVGITEKCQQLAYLGVAFTKASKDAKSASIQNIIVDDKNKVRKDKLIQKKTNLDKVIQEKNEQLRNMIVDRQTLQARSSGSWSEKNIFTKIDLINVLVVALLAGLVIL